MTTITELEALAIAAMSPAPYERAQGQAGLIAAGIMQNILALIALARQQHEALSLVHKAMPTTLTCDDFHHSKKDRHDVEATCPVTARYYYAESMADEALAAFENFGKE